MGGFFPALAGRGRVHHDRRRSWVPVAHEVRGSCTRAPTPECPGGLVSGERAGSVVPGYLADGEATELLRQVSQGVGGVSRASVHPADHLQAAVLSLCEWWVGLSAEERSGLLEVAELAEIDRKVDAAVLGEAT
jgi:hypothetical protein